MQEVGESLYKVDKIYTPKDCNSILKYIDIKSAEDTNKEAPKDENKTIKEYSAAFVIFTFSCVVVWCCILAVLLLVIEVKV